MTTTPNPSTRGRGWAYTGTILGGGISIAANVAHSFVPPAGAPDTWAPNPGAVAGSIVWPVILFIAVEILARVRWPEGLWWSVMRFGGMLPVALVAGLVSYRHLSSLLRFYGEDAIVSILGPLAVDGLMVMATSALLVLGNRTTEPTTAPADTTTQPAFSTPVTPQRADSAYPPAATHHHHDTPADTVVGDDPVALPAHLIRAAQFATANHANTHPHERMTGDDLAAAINVTPGVARLLLAAIEPTTTVVEPAVPAHVNGHAVQITAGAR
ncbi:hypothetical protein F4553_003957 [Allocatelliglobosispora scoriae]|uniref:DUF2637 domain-containing protein n=1 Tax=Allocatelliglobosispora scoriae TaxID=643052 RepID=A0A841BT41_9ACTN|nr:hypothetical protein [Allocatelliglobosispora scoriae]MBB5870578.1 hypothetical protein [Allocatelliglobosispora scoriae]